MAAFRSTSLREARLVLTKEQIKKGMNLDPLASGRLDCRTLVTMFYIANI